MAWRGKARHGFFENEKEKDKRFRWVRHGMAARGEAGQGEARRGFLQRIDGMKKYKVGELIEDMELYPRSAVDTQHIAYMVESAQTGVTFPPVVIDQKTKIIIDGFHRCRMYRRVYGDEHVIDCITINYKDRPAMLLDAIRYNAGHGRTLSRHDRVHCILVGERMGIPEDELASSLSMTIDKLGELRTARVGTLRVANTTQKVPLKRTIKHMSGHRLTKRQSEANDKLSGMNQTFYVNQLITLIDADLIDHENEDLLTRLRVLSGLLQAMELPEPFVTA